MAAAGPRVAMVAAGAVWLVSVPLFVLFVPDATD